MVLDLGNIQMIPGVENLNKGTQVCTDDEQEEVFFYLCKKYNVTDAMVAEVFPY